MRTFHHWVGANGLKMLLLSIGLMGLSGGLTLLWALRWVWSRAQHAPALSDSFGPLVVAGKQLRECQPDYEYRQRLSRAATEWQRHPRTIYLLGGETSPCNGLSEAAAGRRYLLEQGVDATAIQLEQHSRHTLENLTALRSLAGGQFSFTLISNRYHLARLEIMAQGLGLTANLCAAEPDWRGALRQLPRLLVEAFYVHWYWVGRKWAQLVGDRASLDRIC